MAAHPCPCGRYGAGGTNGDACKCSVNDIARYRARLSGPLADRLDLRVTVAPVALSAMGDGGEESSTAVRTRVVAARALHGMAGPTPDAHTWLRNTR